LELLAAGANRQTPNGHPGDTVRRVLDMRSSARPRPSRAVTIEHGRRKAALLLRRRRSGASPDFPGHLLRIWATNAGL
jgi:hypothetical protein